MSDNKNYYAIIPANVRYDKRLNSSAKLLYGEITALTNEKGYCWASNRYFAELYEVSTSTISRLINLLYEYGYIKIVYIKNNENIDKRKIYMSFDKETGIGKNDKTVCEKISAPYDQKCEDGICKNVKDNNTINNKTNTREKEDPEKELKQYEPGKYENKQCDNNKNPVKEFETFSLELCKNYSLLTAKTATSITQLPCFRTIQEQTNLQEVFYGRRYDAMFSCVKAYQIAKTKPAEKRWFSFVDNLLIFLKEGYNGEIKRRYTPEEIKKIEEKKAMKIIKESEEDTKREDMTDEEISLSVEEIKKQMSNAFSFKEISK